MRHERRAAAVERKNSPRSISPQTDLFFRIESSESAEFKRSLNVTGNWVVKPTRTYWLVNSLPRVTRWDNATDGIKRCIIIIIITIDTRDSRIGDVAVVFVGEREIYDRVYYCCIRTLSCTSKRGVFPRVPNNTPTPTPNQEPDRRGSCRWRRCTRILTINKRRYTPTPGSRAF